MGSISLLIDSPLTTLMHAMKGLDKEVRTQIGRHTKAQAQPMWAEATRGQVTTRMQTRLADTATTSVTTRNVFLKAGGKGTIGGSPMSEFVSGIEFGANPERVVKSVSSRGKTYKRRLGTGFGRPRRGGYVAYPAASELIPRIASLWVQTAIRTVHEAVEKVN